MTFVKELSNMSLSPNAPPSAPPSGSLSLESLDLVVRYSACTGGLITTTLTAADPVITETCLTSEMTKHSSLTAYIQTSPATASDSGFGNPTLLSVVLVPASKVTSKSTILVTSATITAAPSSSVSPQRPFGTAIAGIAVGATVVVLVLLASGWCLRRRRRRRRNVESGNETINRAGSKTFRKAELEGTAGSSTFEWRPKPELPVTEVIMPEAPDDITSRIPAAAVDQQIINPHQELEAVPIAELRSRPSEMRSPSTGITATEQSEEPAAPESPGPSQSAPAIEGGLRRQHHNEIPPPKSTELTEPS